MRELAFASRGVRCSGWHFAGSQTGELFDERRRGCVVMAHGMMGTRDSGLQPYAEAFSAAGLDVLLFDFRCLGDSGGEPRQLVSFSAQCQDYRAALACARGLPGVDPTRIVLWGTSYSGGHVVAEAARDGRIAAVIAQVPGLDSQAGLRAILAREGPGHLARLTLHAFRDLTRAATRRGAHRIPVFGAPGSLAFATAPDAEPGFAAIGGANYRNEACARIGLTGALHRPIRRVADLCCPLLIQIAERDAVVPPEPARRAASLAGAGAELIGYPIEHFDIYVGEARERAIADQLQFLRRNLPAPRSS